MLKEVIFSIALVSILSSCSSERAEDILQNENNKKESLKTERRARIKKQIETWPSEPDYQQTFNALDPSLPIAGQITTSPFNPKDEYWGLPRNEGYDLVDIYCTACHSLQIVMQQRASSERWDYMLTWMVEEQGMPAIPANEREQIHAYLVKNFGS